jgi:hypothetical protein
MAQNNNLEVQKVNTAVSQWTNSITNLVTKDFELCGVPYDDYSKQCAMSAMTSIYQLVKDSDKIKDLNGLDTSNLREVVGQCASLKLNANAVPRECYFQLRTKKSGENYVQVVEMGIEGDGNDALLRNYGENVDTVYPCWLVKEGDEFSYPKHKGIEMTPPEWEEKGLSQKVIRIVYPLKLKDGTFQYLIAERDGVKVNLFAHVRNNLMNETFGILKGTNSKGKARTRYDATPEEKKQIDAKKEDIFDALIKCSTVDEMLECEVAKPYISAAWLDTPESMIVRKMRNNAIKKYRKDFNSMAKQSFNQLDETYVQTQEEIAENANTEDFPVEPEVAETVEEPKMADKPEKVETVVENDENVPEFMKD